MADINGIDPVSGQPISVPQEAAAKAYREGKLRFKPGERVPVVANGQAGTMLSEDLDPALQAGLIDFNFDPHGDAKAYGAAALSSATLGGSDWLAVEGSRLLGGDEAAEKTKESLRALQEEHPKSTAAGDLSGALATLLIPGEEEVGAAKLAEDAGVIPEAVHGATDVAVSASGDAASARNATAVAEALPAESSVAAYEAPGQTAQAAAAAQAASGATKGSILARAINAANPYNIVGGIGEAVQTGLGELLGESGLAQGIGTIGRFGAEGAVIGLADAADEDELGDPNLTAEAYLASAEHGALWGSALGLVGAGGKRILTGASRMAGRYADRLAEAHLGGSPSEMGRAGQRWGRGSLGQFMLENGWSPLMTHEQQYRWAQSVKERIGVDLGRVLEDHGKQADMGAKELIDSVFPAIDEAEQKYVIAGGPTGIGQKLKQDFLDSIGWKSDPPSPTPIGPQVEEETYQQLVKERGVPEIPKAPKLTTDRAISATAREKFLRERSFFNPTAQDVIAEKNKTIAEAGEAYKAAVAEFGYGSPEAGAAGKRVVEASMMPAGPKQARELGMTRKAKELEALRAEALTRYGRERYAYDKLVEQHGALRRVAKERVMQQADGQLRDWLRLKAATEAHNEMLRVRPDVSKPVREKWDKHIPWNRSPDAVMNAAAEIKHAARSALEGKIEEGFDRAAREVKDPAVLGRYLHAKTQYGMASDIARMASRGERRAAGLLGRPSRVGNLPWNVAAGITEVALGHPVAAAASIVGGHVARRFGPPLAAWGLHKAAKLAELKALRQEYLIGIRRSTRAAVDGNVSTAFSRVKVAEIPPHELRQTAAEAMAHIYRMGGNPAELRARLAAHDPAFPLVAPKTFSAAEGAFRRAVTYLATSIPRKVVTAMANGDVPTARDLSDHEARDFLTNVATVVDPRSGTDMLSRGALSSQIAKAMKISAPTTVGFYSANLKRMAAMNRSRFDFIPPGLKNQLKMLSVNSDPSFTLALQTSAAAFNANNAAVGPANAKGQASGMQHAAATSKGMAPMVGLMATQAQAAEAGPPGRRGRKASSAEDTGL